jgi:uncharacterized membrane protein
MSPETITIQGIALYSNSLGDLARVSPLRTGRKVTVASSLTVWKFDSADGAERASALLKDLSDKQILSIQDAAIVEWEQGKKKPKTRQLFPTTSAGALSGGFWGLLFGLIFFVPFLGAAIGAGMGALMGHVTDYGIKDDFIKQVRSEVVEGTSALFLMSQSASSERVIEEVQKAGLKPTLIDSNLSEDQEARLREAFSE